MDAEALRDSAIIAAPSSVSNPRIAFVRSFSVPCSRSIRLFDSDTRMLGTRRCGVGQKAIGQNVKAGRSLPRRGSPWLAISD